MGDPVVKCEAVRAAAHAAVVELGKTENDEASAALLAESWRILEPFFRDWADSNRHVGGIMEGIFSAARRGAFGQGSDRMVMAKRIRRALMLEHSPESDRRKWAKRFLAALEYAAAEQVRNLRHPPESRT